MRVHVPIHLRWGDLDAYNHVNNVTMLRLLEEARVRVFWAPESPDDVPPPTAIIEAGAGSPTLTLIASHQIEYVLPMEYQRKPIDVQLWIGRIGGASADLSYEVYAKGQLHVKATTTMVFIDAATSRPRRVSDAERDAWAPYIEEPVLFKRQ